MNASESLELKDFEVEDISDVLVKIEKSFGLTWEKDTFKNATTFGDLCDIISSKIDLQHTDDCTTQQAFYKIRESIAHTQLFDKKTITPTSELGGLFPRKGRRHTISQIRKDSGLSLKILKPKEWVSNTLLLGLLASIVELFFNWRYGLLALGATIFGFQLASWLGREFRVKTAGEAATMAARENYIKSRRNPKTVNRKEILEKIKELFSHDLDLHPSILTREAALF